MCRTAAALSSKRQRSPGSLRRPTYGGIAGLGSLRRIENQELREMLLPRRPATVDLPSNSTTTRMPRQPDSTEGLSKLIGHNDSWERSPIPRPQKKLKKLKLLEELQKEPLMTREEMKESKKWKAMEDIVDMAYMIRVSDEHVLGKLLEEDIEDEEDGYVMSPEQKLRKACEKPSIHLQQCREHRSPAIGPGVLLV